MATFLFLTALKVGVKINHKVFKHVQTIIPLRFQSMTAPFQRNRTARTKLAYQGSILTGMPASIACFFQPFRESDINRMKFPATTSAPKVSYRPLLEVGNCTFTFTTSMK